MQSCPQEKPACQQSPGLPASRGNFLAFLLTHPQKNPQISMHSDPKEHPYTPGTPSNPDAGHDALTDSHIPSWGLHFSYIKAHLDLIG